MEASEYRAQNEENAGAEVRGATLVNRYMYRILWYLHGEAKGQI
jgi:hypothetical protein